MALSLNGTTQYANVAGTQLSSVNNIWTISAWFRPAALTSVMNVFGWNRTSDSAYRGDQIVVRGNQSGDNVALAYSDTDSFANGSSTTLNTWYLCIISKTTTGSSSQSYNIYLNSTTPVTYTGLTSGMPTVAELTIGARKNSSTAGRYFSGNVAHIAVWDNYNLSNTEISDLMGATKRPDAIATTPTYYRRLVSDSTTGVGETTLTLFNSPTFSSLDPITSSPNIISVDGDNIITVDQQNVTINGEVLGNAISAKIKTGTREVSVLNYTQSNTSPTFNTPNLSSFLSSNVKFGSTATLSLVNSTSEITNTTITVNAPAGYKTAIVFDASQNTDPNCLYYNQSPPVTASDIILYDAVTSKGYDLTIDSLGYPVINASSNVSDSFTYRIYSTITEYWSSLGTVSVNGSIGNPVAKTLTIRTSNDGIGYAKYPTGNHESWFLRDKEYAQTRIPVKIIAPRPNAELTANSRYKWAHSDFNYEVPIIVMGGTPPFYFEVTGVAGATIERKSPAHNPGAYSWGVLTIPANTVSSWSSAQTINVNVYDQLSKSSPVANVSWQITKSNSQFIFVDAVNGNDSNSGNIASPFKTINGYYKSNKNDTSYAEKTVVYRSGNYVLDRWDSVGTSGYLYWPTGKPRGHIGYPGETAVWDFRTMAANVTSRATYAADLFFFGAQHDWFFGNVSTEGGNHLFQFTYGDDRITFWNVTANGMSVPSWENDNRGVFSTLVPGSGSYEYIGLCDMRVTNANNAAGLNNGGIITYIIDNIALDGIVFSNCNATDSIFLKAQVGNATVTGCSVWNDNYSHSRTLNFYNADGANVYPSKLIQTRYTRVASNSDSSGVLEYGTNQPFGIVYVDRCSVIGKTILDFPSNGSGYIIDSVVVNDLTPKVDADISQNSVLTYSRSGSILDANGNFTSSSKYKTLIGQEVRNIG